MGNTGSKWLSGWLGLNHEEAEKNKPVQDIPILIIGGGPTGLLLAHLLSELKIKSLVVERYPHRLGAPKAHALSPRSLEICRQSNLDVRKIRTLGTSRKDAFWVNFVTSLSGERIGVLPYERMDTKVLEVTPEMIHNIPQPDFEEFLSENLTHSEYAEIRKGASFVALNQSPGSKTVMTTVEERKTGRQYQIQSRHVIACDGARSKVRAFLGIESEGEETYDTMMTIHFNADLRHILGDRVGMLHWVMDPEVSGFVIGYDLSGNQVLICNFDPRTIPLEDWNEQRCRQIVDKAIGKQITYDILGFRPWTLSRKVAKDYRKGNVLLAGDAAHAFPPTGGLGLNSGLGDVHNLAYKLAGVHKGWASEFILDSYQSDRQMVANVNAQQSVENGKRIFGLLKSIGTAGIKNPVDARANLMKTIHDPTKQQEIQEQIEAQREHFDNLELHIGYVYDSKTIPPHASNYTRKWVKGAVFPHTWISLRQYSCHFPKDPVDVSYVDEFSEPDIQSRKFSTLDLLALDSFTMIAGPGIDWKRKIRALHRVLPKVAPKVRIFCLDEDFELSTSSDVQWARESGLRDGRAYLIRPDQHILACFDQSTTEVGISKALRSHVGL
ncbi:FAD binding domain-containing protein [Microthyrium microscopicum]|uniref:FAD binding domain-containing protein n=1 Tax=Microthyrium microscopicum TaxID=703497 RepID=A0A6A6TXI0_9PEZI|nr:FAD binding domain-containing protein [Microthyrium microscopicum]